MKLPSFSFRTSVVILFGTTLGVLTTGCPEPGCPQCTIKRAQFTIDRAEGEIVDVVMHSEGMLTGHCDGEEKPEGCTLTERESLGVLREEEKQEAALPFKTDSDDRVTVRIDVHRKDRDGNVIVQTPAPKVEISK